MSEPAPAARLEVGWLCVDSADPTALATWWQQLLGGTVKEPDADGDVLLEVAPVPLLFLCVPEHKRVKNRVHVDLRVDDYEGAITRAIRLGATAADDVFVGDRWQVLRDPEGNEFCIIRPKVSVGGTTPLGPS